jgi:hypothetical protein
LFFDQIKEDETDSACHASKIQDKHTQQWSEMLET